jgi:hypothetical protein
MHDIDCSKCYEDAQLSLKLRAKYLDAVDFDLEDEEPPRSLVTGCVIGDLTI